MALELYTNAIVSINGAQATEETSVTVDRDNSAQIIKTVAKGFAGLSSGGPMMSIKVDNAVRFSGFEWDPGDAMIDLVPVEISVFAAGLSLTAKGFVTKDSFGHGVDKPSSLSFEWVGPAAKWS